MYRLAPGLLLLFLLAGPREASALITGGEGNSPIGDPGWPKGAAAIFNTRARIAWWEGPPFGGGQWHAECRGDAATLSTILQDFARLDVKAKRIVLHDGIGHSFWLAPNNEPEKLAAARIDWVFMVWQPANWERPHKMPADLNPTEQEEKSPPSEIEVFTGKLRWGDVKVPKGIEVIDQRLEGHGFTTADGIVLEGKVTDLGTRKPVAARMRLQRIEPRKKGGYLYSIVAEATSDPDGHWVLKKAPAGWYRVIVEAGGFVPRVAGYARFDEQPRWQAFDCGLSRSAHISGRITDDAGKPLADVEVRLHDVVPASGGRYESPNEYSFKTDIEGRFRAEQVPAGKATIWLHKPGYCRPGLGQPVTIPTTGVELSMIRAATVRVTVDFTGKKRPPGFIVSIQPEGGEAIGTYGGSGNIDAKNQMNFENVPPGRYVMRGQPNPSSGDQRTEGVTVELKGGQAADVLLIAK